MTGSRSRWYPNQQRADARLKSFDVGSTFSKIMCAMDGLCEKVHTRRDYRVTFCSK